MLDVALSIYDLFRFDPNAVIHTSVRSMTGISSVVLAVYWEVPPPYDLHCDNSNILWVKVLDSWFETLRELICLVQEILEMINYNNRVSIIDLLENLVTTAIDVRRGFGCEGRDRYSLQDVGLILPWMSRAGSIGLDRWFWMLKVFNIFDSPNRVQ